MAETGTHIKGENRYKNCRAEEHSWGSGCGYLDEGSGSSKSWAKGSKFRAKRGSSDH